MISLIFKTKLLKTLGGPRLTWPTRHCLTMVSYLKGRRVQNDKKPYDPCVDFSALWQMRAAMSFDTETTCFSESVIPNFFLP